jgi:hypothetical protein
LVKDIAMTHDRIRRDPGTDRDQPVLATQGATWAPLPADGPGPDAAAAAAGARQIVFIDGSVAGAAALAAGVKPGVVAVLLDPAGNEVQQIAAYLAAHDVHGLAGIAIVAHGADGAIELGGSVLDAASLAGYQGDLAAIGAALQPGGAIQIYGCDVAQDATGTAFLRQLSQATGGAAIAAASHLVGAASQGGSWTLNVDVGHVTAANPFTAAALAGFTGELPAATDTLFADFNDGEDSSLTRVTELGVSGSSEIGSTVDIRDGSQSTTFTNLEGLAVDASGGKYFLVNSDNNTVNQIVSGGLSGGAPTVIYNTPDVADYELGGLAIDQPNHTIYFAEDSDLGNSGIYKISESGGAATALVTGGNISIPIDLALDLPDNLVFFTDNQGIGSGDNNLFVGDLSNGTSTLLNSQLSSTIQNELNTNNAQLTGVAVNAATRTLYFTAQNGATAADNYIFKVSYTPSGSSVSLGAVTTLYSGAGAGDPGAIVIDPAGGVFYTAADGNQSIDEGSLSGGSSVSQVYQESSSQPSEPNGLFILSTPSLSAGGSATFVQGGAAVALDSAATVSNEDGQQLASATVEVAGGSFATDGDTLAATTAGTAITASYNPVTETLTLTGDDSAAHYQSVLDSVTFTSTGATAGTRTIDWTVSNGVISSTTPTSSVFVHVHPTLTAGATATFDGGGAGVTLDSGVSVSDPSSATLASATATIGGFISGDTLTVGTTGGLGVSFSNGTLTLTGSASLATYQTALDSVVYSFDPGNGDPTGGGSHTGRTISWQVNDGVLSSTAADSTLDVVHVAPTITAGASVTYHQNGVPLSLDSGLSVTDPDSGGNLASATVSIGSGFLAGDTLGFSNQNGIAGSYDAGTGVLTLSGTSSLTNYQSALESVTYSFTGDPTANGADTARTIDWTVNDGVDSSTASTSSLATLCFCTGTAIATPGGEVAVETLKPGDLVVLADGGTAPVRWLGRHTVARRFADPTRSWPIRVRAGALGEGLPRRDLLLSPGHALRIGDMLVQAAALVNGSSIVREPQVPETFAYWHVELDRHALILAENTPAESFLDTLEDLAFDNRASRPVRPVDAAELPYPRCKAPRQVPRRLREALAARAAVLAPTRGAA